MNDESVFNLAAAHHQAGRLGQAEAEYRQILAHDPSHPAALHMLGLIYSARGDKPAAIELMERAAAAQPTAPEFRINLAITYFENGDRARAAAAARVAMAIAPATLATLFRLATALATIGLAGESIDYFARVLAMDPNHVGAMTGLGVALLGQNRAHDAAAVLKRAASVDPQSADILHHLGQALILSGQTDAAIASYENALRIDPGSAETQCNLANALATAGKLESALAAVNRALFCKPDLAEAHWNKAMILLVQGRLAEGWIEHEWRWIKFADQRRNFRRPRWDGCDIAGKTILLHAEQGAGDTIQFCRYVTDVARRGARIVLEVQAPLAALCASVEGVSQTIARGQPLPEFDTHCPLLSLPFALQINSIEAIALRGPYLHPPEAAVQRWNHTVKPFEGFRKVGVVWAGSPTQNRDFERSARAEIFRPLAAAPGIKLFSLQKSNNNQSPPAELNLVDFTSRLHDYAETAALIANLDMVISVDTSVAHLAGAMGKPVWTLLAHHADWRYFLNRNDSPWYPTMRLCRQPSAGDWKSVIEQVMDQVAG